jgi:hypothetical protein
MPPTTRDITAPNGVTSRAVQSKRNSFLTVDPVAFRTRSRVRYDSRPASGPPFQSITTSSSRAEPSAGRIKMCMAIDRLLAQDKENTENREALAGTDHHARSYTQTAKPAPTRPPSMKLPTSKPQPIKYNVVKSLDRDSCRILTTENQMKYERSLEQVLGDLELPFSQTVPTIGIVRRSYTAAQQESH